jgi:hypothetical protein
MSRLRGALRTLVAVAALAAGTGVIGQAAGLSMSTRDMGAGTAPVQGCLASIPTSGASLRVGVTRRNGGGQLSATGVTISGFPSACDGATLSASLTNSGRPATTGQGSCSIANGAASCSVSPAVTISTGRGRKRTSELPLTLTMAVSGSGGSTGSGQLHVSAAGLVAGTCPAITNVSGRGSTPGYC